MNRTATPDIINHWAAAPNPTPREATRCLSTEEIRQITNGFKESDAPSEEDTKAAILKQLELREKKKRANLARHGSTNGRTKLDEVQVCVMRSMYKVWGLSIAQLAERWNMPRETVRDIIRRRTWTHV